MKTYPIAKSNRTPWCDEATYQAMYAESINDSDAFWAKQAKVFLDWDKGWTQTSNIDYRQGQIEWFKGGELNVFGRVIILMSASLLLTNSYTIKWQNLLMV